MNSKIGERLEEARKRLGISIREASEATKVRGDFLLHFENNYFDFDLPEVYKEGFIKLYSRYLKLSPEKMLNDYRACRQGTRQFFSPIAAASKSQSRESLGRVELPQHQAQKKVSEMVSDFEEDNEEQNFYEQPLKVQSPYVRVGLMFAGGFVAIFALVFIMSSLFSGKKAVNAPTEPEQVVQAAQVASRTVVNQEQVAGRLTLIADNDVHVVVRQELDKQTLFYGTLSKDTQKVLDHEGPVKVRFNDGSHLTIENTAGKRIKPGRSGSGWIEVS